jgi:1-acyl-sn-glycerol-3-phosphate acyltransferase
MTSLQPAPGRIRYHLVRLVLKAVTSAYVRTSVVGADRIPAQGPYIICFNHPSWLDPVFFAAHWPDRRRDLYIFGPREQDMHQGARNALITWTRRGVPFQPGGHDVIDTTRRTVGVLRSGACLAIAGEGRLSDHEGDILPLETGLAHFAKLARAPILPVAVVGTRWISFGSRVAMRVGEAVEPGAYGGGKPGARAMTDEVQARLQALLAGVEEREPPGWLGRTISEAFNERPWLEETRTAGESDAG